MLRDLCDFGILLPVFMLLDYKNLTFTAKSYVILSS